MKLLCAMVILVAAFSVRAQTVANTHNVLHPLTKNSPDGTARYAPTSLDQDPAERASLMQNNSRPSYVAPGQPAKPVAIVAQIDGRLVASKVSLIGTVTGLKGKLYITNIGSASVVPSATFAICDEKGFQIASATKIGSSLGPNDSEKIEIVATNLSAADVQLVKLTAGSDK